MWDLTKAICHYRNTVKSVLYLVVFAVYEGEFKLVLRSVNTQHSWATLAVQTVHTVSLDTRYVDRYVQRPNYTMVSEIFIIIIITLIIIGNIITYNGY